MKYTPHVVRKVSRENSVGTHQVSAWKDGSSHFLKACLVGLWLQRFPSQSRYHTQYRQCILDRPVCTTEIVERNLSAHEHVSEVTAPVCGH